MTTTFRPTKWKINTIHNTTDIVIFRASLFIYHGRHLPNYVQERDHISDAVALIRNNYGYDTATQIVNMLANYGISVMGEGGG